MAIEELQELKRLALAASDRNSTFYAKHVLTYRVAANPAAILDLIAQLEQAKAAITKDDSDILRTIDQRDHAESVIDLLCDAVLGEDRPEWSSGYGFGNAVSDVQERMHALLSAPPAGEMPALDERAAFEQAFIPQSSDRAYWMRKRSNGDYCYYSTQSAWQGWQARAAIAAARAEGV